ncbi:hypothetical protein [Burkholderia sp. F1]|uniref:hypothetical protein n=1 Tax=Burkholderia sp. F1 TaxID=3366817 RepID=UPI003D7631E4
MTSRELTRREALGQLVAELDRVYPQGSYDGDALQNEKGMPDFVTARNGRERQFTRVATRALQALVLAWQKEVPRLAVTLDSAALQTLLQQSVADLHADGQFGNDVAANLACVEQTFERTLAKTETSFTHAFPARTLGMEVDEPYVLGPVTFMTRDQWIEAVEFSDRAKEQYLGGSRDNEQWKPRLRAALSQAKRAVPVDAEPLPGLAAALYGPLSACRSLLRVSLSGYEQSLSVKAARHISKTALDGLSLMLGGRDLFHQQVLVDERMPPVGHYTLLESNGYLRLPGMGLNKQIPILSGRQVKGDLSKASLRPLLDALAHVLDGLVSPSTHSHPLLAMRWAVALDWLAESEREYNEAIALTKIGTSLDVLTEGGRFGGILDMLTHLTGWKEETAFPVGPYTRDLRWLVKELYDHGRSKILHGNVFDRLQSFAEMRRSGAMLARYALIECALRLKSYTGADTSKAFRDIPRPPAAESTDEEAG